MKPAVFSYLAPSSLDEALDALARHAEDAKVLAGGQSLVPSMNFRLARPGVLVDINRLPGLDGIDEMDGSLHIGALARHMRFHEPVVADPLGKLLATAARYVGHLPIRVRGTFGGSIAHADPAAEWCLIATALDAEMIATGSQGQRSIPAPSFFQTVFTTSLDPDEILTEIRLPLLGEDARVGFVEFSRRAGDFAIVAVAVAIRESGGKLQEARIGLGGIGGTPVRATEAEAVLVGQAPTIELFREAAASAARSVDPIGDIHGSAEYRRDLVGVLTRRALEQTLVEG